MTITQAMLAIKSLDDSASLHLSSFTGQWYVAARIYISDGEFLRGAADHADSPEGAVSSFLERLTRVRAPEIVVTRPDDVDRRHWRWNGSFFTDVPIRVPA